MRPHFVAAALVALAAAPALPAQSLLYRSPNLSGSWVADPGVVQFNFIHRFTVTQDPSHVVINSPTFTFATGLGHDAGLGYRFATKSGIPGGASSNESELFGRWRFWEQSEGSEGLAASVSPAWNFKAQSFDVEVAADYTRGPVTALGAVRELTKAFGGSGAQTVLGAGLVFRLNPYVALSGDYAKTLGGDTTAAWSFGVQVLIPGSPHSFALEVSNVSSNTYQGSSRGLSGTTQRLYGFEFTIPLHLSRFAPWFRGGAGPALGASGPAAAEVRVAALKYSSDTVRIAAGQIVRWINRDPLDHTITFDVEGPASGPLPAKGSYAVKFDRAGTFPYHCTPHPFMTGAVIVQ
jgi:amicyanin